MELTGILLVCLIIIFVYLWQQRSLGSPPGPWNFPIVGYLPFLDPQEPHVSLTKLSQKFGKVFGLYLGNVYTVVISDPKIVKKVFNKDAASGRAPLYITHGIMKGYGKLKSFINLALFRWNFRFSLVAPLGRWTQILGVDGSGLVCQLCAYPLSRNFRKIIAHPTWDSSGSQGRPLPRWHSHSSDDLKFKCDDVWPVDPRRIRKPWGHCASEQGRCSPASSLTTKTGMPFTSGDD